MKQHCLKEKNNVSLGGQKQTGSSLVARIDAITNGQRKPLSASMKIFFKAPYNQSQKSVESIAFRLQERKIISIVKHKYTFDSQEPWLESDLLWVSRSMALQTDKVKLWFKKYPRVRIEWNSRLALKLQRTPLQIAERIYKITKKGTGIIMTHSKAKKWIMYVVFDEETQPQQHRKWMNYKSDCLKKPKEVGTKTDVNVTESTMNSVLNEILCGIPKVSKVWAEKLERNEWDVSTGQMVTLTEWGCVTVGSNYSELVKIPCVDFERSQTNYGLDVYQFLGIEAARRWYIMNLEDTIRGGNSKMALSHILLMADFVTHHETLTVLTHGGISKSSQSPSCGLFVDVISRWRLYTTTGQEDKLLGVHENVFWGNNGPVGSTKVHTLPALEWKRDQDQLLQTLQSSSIPSQPLASGTNPSTSSSLQDGVTMGKEKEVEVDLQKMMDHRKHIEEKFSFMFPKQSTTEKTSTDVVLMDESKDLVCCSTTTNESKEMMVPDAKNESTEKSQASPDALKTTNSANFVLSGPMRQFPIQIRSLRFYQQWVSVKRNGTIMDHERQTIHQPDPSMALFRQRYLSDQYLYLKNESLSSLQSTEKRRPIIHTPMIKELQHHPLWTPDSTRSILVNRMNHMMVEPEKQLQLIQEHTQKQKKNDTSWNSHPNKRVKEISSSSGMETEGMERMESAESMDLQNTDSKIIQELDLCFTLIHVRTFFFNLDGL